MARSGRTRGRCVVWPVCGHYVGCRAGAAGLRVRTGARLMLRARSAGTRPGPKCAVRMALAEGAWPGTANAYTESMGGPVQDVPVSSPAIERAVDLARRGVITHLTIHGERVAAIVPESVIDALRTAEDAEDAAEADAAMDEPGESIPWEQIKAELEL
jgi:hypothetical protein